MRRLMIGAFAALAAAVSFAEDEPFHFEGELTELMRTDGAGWWSASYQGVSYFADWSHEDKLFDGKANNVLNERFIVTGWSGVPLTYQISKGYRRGAEVKLTAYEFVAPASNAGRAPTSWKLEGSSDGETWEPLDTHTGESGFSKDLECRRYELSKPFAGRWFRLAVTANAYDGFLSMQEVRLFGSVDGGGPSGLSLDDCEISGVEPLYVNNSNDCSPMNPPTIVLSCDGGVLVAGTDYEVSWSNLKVGPGTLTITGLGRFAGGERSFDYTVIGDLTAYMRVNHPEWVYWSAPGMGYFTYAGTTLLNLDFAFDGDVTVVDGKRCLFEKSKSSRWPADGGTIDIFYGNCMIGDAFRSGGEMVVHHYEIYQQDNGGRIFRAWTLSGSNDGEHWVELDARTGVSGTGKVVCEIAEEKRASYRRYKLTVSDGGNGSYTGLMELKLWGSIAGCEESREPTIADCDIDPIPPEERLYDGINPVEPKTIVRFGNEILTACEDYEIAFENNHKVGKGRLILIGKGKWTGRLVYRFTITQADETDVTAAVRAVDGATFASTGKMLAGTSVTNLFDGVTDVEKGPPDGRYMAEFKNGTTTVDITYSIDLELAGKTSTFVLSGYSFVTQETQSNRHPASWTLYGSKTGEEGSWQVLDAQEDALDVGSPGGKEYRFDIPEENRGDYRHYKMTITKISGNGGYCGARELIFYGRVTNPKPGLILLLW